MEPISLLFSGDFAPLVPVERLSNDHFEGLSDIFTSSDLHITNLECPLTSTSEPIEKTGPSIKADHSTITLLKQAKVNIACLANNHIFDYGEKGINETIEICEKNNIETLGIVSRTDRTYHWLIKELKGKKIGILNYCEHEFSVREKGLLGACGYDPVNAYYDVMYLRPIVDYLIVIYHGGNEYYPLPRPDMKKDFHYLADLGVDAVIGHHTHVFSGYEIYNGKPLVYSLGNFFFPYEGEPESWHSGLLCQLKIEDNIEIELMPVLQCFKGFKVTIESNEKSEIILNKIEILSDLINNDSELHSKWDDYVNTIGNGISYQTLFPTKIDKAFLKLPLLNKFVKDRRRERSLLNTLRCKSLRQLLINNLKSK